MSSYADYSSYSKHYDDLRSALGIELYFGLLVCKLGKPLKHLHVLDAGCGTGNYSLSLLRLGVGKVTLLDTNPGMLAKAREKLSLAGGFEGRYEFKEHKLPELPFHDGTFDCVMMNNVLHHLVVANSDGTAEKTAGNEAIQNVSRVLKPEGIFFLLDTFDVQIEKGVWYWGFNPRVSKLLKARAPNYDDICATLKSSGFNMDTLQSFPRLEGYPSIQDVEGTFVKEIRESVSWFAEFTEEETEEMLATLNQMKEDGTLMEYFEKMDATRKEVGQMTFMTVQKC